MTFVRYDRANGPSKGPAPGAVALRDHWTKVTGLPDLGIYNPRKIRGASGWSVHAEGRAVDFAANANHPAQKAAADRYCQFLIDNAQPLQVQYLIWNRRSWKPDRGWQRYQGTSPHTDHVHAELNRDGARTVTASQLAALWVDWTSDHTTEESDDMDPRAFVVLTYLSVLGRKPETLKVITDGVRAITKHPGGEREGQNAYLVSVIESPEGRKRWS